MLNITNRISLSRKSRAHIKSYKNRIGGSLKSNSWDKIRNSVKNEFSSKLFKSHGFKCVYCERYLIGLNHQMDHFAHKAQYPQFTFTPLNIFYSCGFCNSTERKGQNNTVVTLNNKYDKCIFLIVHPYFNNYNAEVIYHDADRIYIDRNSCSVLGVNTIDFFRFDDDFYTLLRARTLLYERLNPLTSKQEKKLIQESISYNY